MTLVPTATQSQTTRAPELSRVSDRNSVATTTVPQISPRLKTAMDLVLSPHPDAGRCEIAWQDQVEASQIAAALAAHLRPAAADDWYTFLMPLAGLPNGPADAERLRAHSCVMAFAFPELPAVLLDRVRQASALRRFQFFPTPKEVGDWLMPYARPLRHKLYAIETIANGGVHPRHAR